MIGEGNISQVYVKDRAIYSINPAITDQVSIDDIITADGWNQTRHLITANGSMPGPSIIIYEKQKITILVTNHMINEAVTIHWHGIDQLGWPAMDGVAFVSQCPILPGQTFNYTFQPTFGGSYWYHSHVGNQRDMGMYGAFIVLRKRDSVPFEFQHIVQIQEWNHLYNAMDLLYANVKDEVKSPNSILINGRGELKDNLAPLETFHVKKGDRCLFRLIGVGSMHVLLFSIAGLKLDVTETDLQFLSAVFCIVYGMTGTVVGFHCDENVHCFTSLDIKSAFTMIGKGNIGQVYVKDRAIYSINAAINDQIPIDDIITADGWNHTRHLITANGSMPGPSIIIYENQKITIIVKNHMINEAVTIHWHGIDQYQWPAMDGVAFVSQCPILPGQTFNYTFQPTFGESYWYHSHVGNQRDMGMYGAFVILRKRDSVPFEFQNIVQIQEWNHLYNAMDLLYANVKDEVKSPNSILINGRGELK
ncbi:unnamed protein product [Mytilus edulis]|uniref:Multicopper oxidase n=1 Tax=Mytilus edulis TaxID=6550 RepID=A0A8S3TE24_MYTED|nr:unnamed protein product [Mytilus edulis]